MKIADSLLRYRIPLFDTPPEPKAGGDPTPEPKPSLLGGDPDPTPDPDPDPTPDPDPNGGDPDPDPEPNADPAPEPLTVESYKFPEGVEVDNALLEPFTELMNNNDLSRADLAQGIIDLQIDAAQKATVSAQEAAQTLWTDTQTEWQDATKALPTLGGEQVEKTLATIKAGVESLGENLKDDVAKAAWAETYKGWKNAMDLTGAGNHPAIIQVLHALTKNLVEGGPVRGDQTQVPRTQADRMFGSNKS